MEGTFVVHGIRYQTRDVNRAVAFYTRHLGFELTHQQGTVFASVSCGGLTLLLSGPGSSGARPLPDGQEQRPGGSNRLVLAVSDLRRIVTAMRGRGLRFRTDIVEGPADDRFNCSIQTTTPSNCSSLPPVLE